VTWLKRLGLTLAVLVMTGTIVRLLNPLPSLENRTRSEAFADTANTPLGQAIAPLAKAHPGLTGVYSLADPKEAFAARALLARAATQSIDAQYYIWRGDLTGRLLLNELRAAAGRGVRVRLLLDDNNTSGLDPLIATLDAHPNIEVRLFNPFTIRGFRLIGFATDFFRLNRRMHNKSFTADNQATIVGGRNIGDEYFGAGSGALFVDLDVLAVGAVVPEISRDFDRYWSSASAYPASRIVTPLSGAEQDNVRAGLSATAARADAREYLLAMGELPLSNRVGRSRAFEWAPVRMMSDDPAKGLGRAESGGLLFPQLVKSMGEPNQRFDLVSGYFVPAKVGTRTLTEMAERGVAVTVLTNALEATDVPIVHAGYAKQRKPLLRAGVRIFELRGSDAAARPVRTAFGRAGSSISGSQSALHAKTMDVDGERVFVGSFNFDPRSANLNTELGFVIESRRLAADMNTTLERFAAVRAYEVRLSRSGELYWIERLDGKERRHTTEPGTTWRQRAWVAVLSLLPIDWLL
jgi:putative cardiolipin synthase